MPEVAAPVAPVVPQTQTATSTPKPAAPVASGTKPPDAAQTSASDADFFELNISGEKERRSWSDPETRKAAVAALQKQRYAEKSISDSRTAHKALQKHKAELDAAVVRARQGDPSALLQVLNIDSKQAAADPAVLIKALGGDPDVYARQLLSEKLKMEGMTPEQRRIAELEAKHAEAERKLGQLSEQRRAERVQAKAKMEQGRLFREISEAAERVGLSADESSLRYIHQVMEEMHRDGLPFVPDFIVQEAKERMEGTFKRLEEHTLKGLKGAQLVQRLGPEVMRELRTHLIGDRSFIKEVRAMLAEKLRAGQSLDAPAVEQPKQNAPASQGGNANGYISMDALDEQVKQMGRRHG